MFVPDTYSDFKYLVSYSDNYVVLTDVKSVNGSWDNPRSIDIIVQYFNPSIYTLESSSTFTTTRNFEQIELSSFDLDRADYPEILQSTFLVIFFILFILNGITKFFKRGGIFFGS